MKKVLPTAFLLFVFAFAANAQQFQLQASSGIGGLQRSVNGGYFLLAGYDSAGITGTRVLRLNEQLEVQWEKVLVDADVSSFAQDSTGEIYFTGQAPSGTLTNVLVIKTDSLVQVIWSKQYEHAPFNSWGEKIIKHSSGVLFVMGASYEPFNPFELLRLLY
jgi:hypothetical protein